MPFSNSAFEISAVRQATILSSITKHGDQFEEQFRCFTPLDEQKNRSIVITGTIVTHARSISR